MLTRPCWRRWRQWRYAREVRLELDECLGIEEGIIFRAYSRATRVRVERWKKRYESDDRSCPRGCECPVIVHIMVQGWWGKRWVLTGWPRDGGDGLVVIFCAWSAILFVVCNDDDNCYAFWSGGSKQILARKWLDRCIILILVNPRSHVFKSTSNHQSKNCS